MRKCWITAIEIIFGIHDERRLLPGHSTSMYHLQGLFAFDGVVRSGSRAMLPDGTLPTALLALAIIAETESSPVPGESEAKTVALNAGIARSNSVFLIQNMD